MSQFFSIQRNIPCEPCIVCGSRPVIQCISGAKYMVRCPNDEGHYQTKPGLIDIDDWNRNNRPIQPLSDNLPRDEAR